MKRLLAIFLPLLLLLPLAGCKKAKNYIVKEIDGQKRFSLSDKDWERTNKEIEERGYSITYLKGFSDEDFHGQGMPFESYGDEKSAFSLTKFAAKCHLTKEPEVIMVQFREEEEKFIYFTYVCTMKIDRLFYTQGEEKEGDEVKVILDFIGSNYSTFWSDERTRMGIRLSRLIRGIVPSIENPFYILANHLSEDYYLDNRNDVYRSITRLIDAHPFGVIEEIEPGKYLFNSTFGSLAEGAKKIEGANELVEADMILETDDFDERFQAMINKYKK